MTITLRPQTVKAILEQAGHRAAQPMGTVAGGGYLPGCDTSYERVSPVSNAKTGRITVIYRGGGYDKTVDALTRYALTLEAEGLTIQPGDGCLYVTDRRAAA